MALLAGSAFQVEGTAGSEGAGVGGLEPARVRRGPRADGAAEPSLRLCLLPWRSGAAGERGCRVCGATVGLAVLTSSAP